MIIAMKTWNQERIGRVLQQKDSQWYFNPTAANHQGGVWKRLIRTVRILHSIVCEHPVKEEALTTFHVEVEKLLDRRPITRVSSNPNDLDALTPNDILLLRQNSNSLSGEFEDLDRIKAKWKHVNVLANEFRYAG